MGVNRVALFPLTSGTQALPPLGPCSVQFPIPLAFPQQRSGILECPGRGRSFQLLWTSGSSFGKMYPRSEGVFYLEPSLWVSPFSCTPILMTRELLPSLGWCESHAVWKEGVLPPPALLRLVPETGVPESDPGQFLYRLQGANSWGHCSRESWRHSLGKCIDKVCRNER